mmetsp:Transcript_14055/g.34814  ORF Transcript_14055/g.34814 Transcript_14055/m.34814 type:complete len:248 (-) Transcript_14055:681-1424(-)
MAAFTGFAFPTIQLSAPRQTLSYVPQPGPPSNGPTAPQQALQRQAYIPQPQNAATALQQRPQTTASSSQRATFAGASAFQQPQFARPHPGLTQPQLGFPSVAPVSRSYVPPPTAHQRACMEEDEDAPVVNTWCGVGIDPATGGIEIFGPAGGSLEALKAVPALKSLGKEQLRFVDCSGAGASGAGASGAGSAVPPGQGPTAEKKRTSQHLHSSGGVGDPRDQVQGQGQPPLAQLPASGAWSSSTRRG